MKKLTTIVALILLFSMLLCSCNNIKTPPEESGTPSATPEETPLETEPEEEIYNFEKGETSIELARQLKPLMTVALARMVLKTWPMEPLTSSITSRRYCNLVEGGYLWYEFKAADDIVSDDMTGKQHVNVLIYAYIESEDGSREYLFDVSSEENLTSDSILYEPMVSLDKLSLIEKGMSMEEVMALLDDGYGESPGDGRYFYTLEDMRDLTLTYALDSKGSYILTSASISSYVITENEKIYSVDILFE